MENLWQYQSLGVILGTEIYTPKSMNIKRNIIFTLESRKKGGVSLLRMYLSVCVSISLPSGLSSRQAIALMQPSEMRISNVQR